MNSLVLVFPFELMIFHYFVSYHAFRGIYH